MPYRPEVAGEGRGLHLLDLSGQELPTDQALLWIGMPVEAAIYQRRTRARNVTSILLFASSGVALLGIPPLVMGVDAPCGGTSRPSRRCR
jgi:hypothetical protein